MNRLLQLVVMLTVTVPMLLFAGSSEEEKKPTVEEVGGDEVAPWILEMRKGLEPYRGEINYKGEYGKTPTWDTELVLTSFEGS